MLYSYTRYNIASISNDFDYFQEKTCATFLPTLVNMYIFIHYYSEYACVERSS